MKGKFLVIILLFIPLSLFSQRHYKGVAGWEGSFGSRLSGQTFDPFASVYYSSYTGYRTFWKFGFNYWDSEIKVAGRYREHCPFLNMEFRYAYTLLNVGENLFISIEGGGFLGMERFTRFSAYENPVREPYVDFPNKFRKNKFVCGPSVGLEFELFLSKQVGFIFNVGEYYSPMSQVEKWHTVGSVGIKLLMY